MSSFLFSACTRSLSFRVPLVPFNSGVTSIALPVCFLSPGFLKVILAFSGTPSLFWSLRGSSIGLTSHITVSLQVTHPMTAKLQCLLLLKDGGVHTTVASTTPSIHFYLSFWRQQKQLRRVKPVESVACSLRLYFPHLTFWGIPFLIWEIKVLPLPSLCLFPKNQRHQACLLCKKVYSFQITTCIHFCVTHFYFSLSRDSFSHCN